MRGRGKVSERVSVCVGEEERKGEGEDNGEQSTKERGRLKESVMKIRRG